MKVLLLLILFALTLIIGAVIGPHISNDPGVVLVTFQGWQLKISLIGLLVLVIGFWVLLKFVIFLIKLPAKASSRIKNKLGKKDTTAKALIALEKGDWKRAEKALIEPVKDENLQATHYLLAAQVASEDDRTENYKRQQHYFSLAAEKNPKTNFASLLLQTKLAIQEEQFEEALANIKTLDEQQQQHPSTLALLAKIYLELEQFDELHALIPKLRKYKVAPEEQILAYDIAIITHQLRAAENIDALDKIYRSLNKKMRQNLAILVAYVAACKRLDVVEIAEKIILTHLKKEWSPQLVSELTDLDVKEPIKLLKQLEPQQEKQPNDPILLRVLGVLCTKAELWGKAENYLNTSFSLEPSKHTAFALAEFYEKTGEINKALECYHNAR